MFPLFRTLITEEYRNLLCSRMDSSITATHIHAQVWSLKVVGALIMSRNEAWVLLRRSCSTEKDRRKTAVSYRRFPLLHTCIIQFNIFPFYGSKYSWMIRAQGELVRKKKLGESLRTCFLRRMFGPGLFSLPPCFNKISIATSPSYPRILCSITPSPANEIMNSRLDTKADEGIFEHSKGERGEKEGGEREHSQN